MLQTNMTKTQLKIIKLAERLSKHAADINAAGEWQIVVPYEGNLIHVSKYQTVNDVVDGTYTYELCNVVAIQLNEEYDE